MLLETQLRRYYNRLLMFLGVYVHATPLSYVPVGIEAQFIIQRRIDALYISVHKQIMFKYTRQPITANQSAPLEFIPNLPHDKYSTPDGFSWNLICFFFRLFNPIHASLRARDQRLQLTPFRHCSRDSQLPEFRSQAITDSGNEH